MIKNACDLCGAEIKMKDELCQDCQQMKKKLQECGKVIVQAAGQVAEELHLKGVEMTNEAKDFQEKMMTKFFSTAEKILDDRFKAIEREIGRLGVSQ
jgi:NMD protein affecting ribosome stability and mRNA decay